MKKREKLFKDIDSLLDDYYNTGFIDGQSEYNNKRECCDCKWWPKRGQEQFCIDTKGLILAWEHSYGCMRYEQKDDSWLDFRVKD